MPEYTVLFWYVFSITLKWLLWIVGMDLMNFAINRLISILPVWTGSVTGDKKLADVIRSRVREKLKAVKVRMLSWK